MHQIVPRIHSESSGTTYVVPKLCDSLHHLGVDVHLHVIRAAQQEYRYPLHVHRFWPGLERIGYSPAMKKALSRALAAQNCILHNHSLWMMPNVYSGQLAARYPQTKLIVSPHGTLSSWALNNSGARKRLLWQLGQRKAFEVAHCFHATAESEYEDIRKLGYRQPVAVIPNGVEFPEIMPPLAAEKKPYRLLFLGRLHPIKGLDNLLTAWRDLYQHFGQWELVIVGPEDKPGYKNSLQQKIADDGLQNIRFADPVFGDDKGRLYAEAELFVLPTHSENFGITVAEALYQRTPAVVTDGAPWKVLNSAECGWWIKNSVEELRRTLHHAMSLPREERATMGNKGHELVTHSFSWQEIGEKMLRTYYWMLTNQEKPNWIIND